MSFALRRGVCQDFAQVLNKRVYGRKSRISGGRANERLTAIASVSSGKLDYRRHDLAHGWPAWPAPGRGGAF
jgi:hypothetical protein